MASVSRHCFSTLVIIYLVCLGLYSCHTEQSADTITLWSSNNNAEIVFMDSMVTKWNQLHPDSRISSQPIPEGQSSEEVILAALVGKTTPDIYANIWQGNVEAYAQAGKLIALDTLDGFLDFIAERSGQSTIEEITSSDGHIYQVPWKINPIMNLFNDRVYSHYDFSDKKLTYTAFNELAEAIKTDQDNDGYIDHWIGYTSVKPIWHQRLFNFYPLYLAASNGKPLIVDNRAAFNNEEAIGVFRFLQDIYRQDYFSKQSSTTMLDQLFMKEKVLSQWTGPWTISHLEKFKPEDLHYSFSNLPVPDEHEGPVYTYSDPKNIVIFSSCQRPQEAWEFIRFMIDTENDFLFMRSSGQLPNRGNILTDSLYLTFFDQNPHFRSFAEQSQNIQGVDNCDVIIEVLDMISQEYEACVIYDKKSPEEAIADAEKAVNLLLGN